MNYWLWKIIAINVELSWESDYIFPPTVKKRNCKAKIWLMRRYCSTEKEQISAVFRLVATRLNQPDLTARVIQERQYLTTVDSDSILDVCLFHF